MVTVKIPGMKDVKLTPIEFDALVQAMYKMIMWDAGGMYGNGQEIDDKVGLVRAKRILKKLGY